jgi:hypothetical protein
MIFGVALVVANTIADQIRRHDLKQMLACFSGLATLQDQVPDGPARYARLRARLLAACAAENVFLLLPP